MLSGMPDSRGHLSMLRSYTAADLFTIGNASCGTIAIFLCLDYLASGNPRLLWYAFILLPAALVCDVLDGIVARTVKRRQSVLGGDLGLARRCDLVRRGASRHRLHAGAARRLGRAVSDISGRLWRQPSRAVQRHGRGARGYDDGEGEVLRGHTDSDDDRHCGHVGGRVRVGSYWRAVCGSVSSTSVRGCCTRSHWFMWRAGVQ